jgi:SAM-dependent MidA family methyltransferase
MEKEKSSQKEGLREFILSQIEEKGPLPFSQFMEWCLYHPEHGYYSSKQTKIGKDGDYYTSSCVHPLFGHLIAKQLCQMAEILEGETFHVIEMGGGRGFLCEDILDCSKEEFPAFYDRIEYHLFETARPFLEEQRERLSGHEKQAKVFWGNPKAFAKRSLQIQGCFLSNELVDSFPTHRIVLDQGNVREIYVTHRHGHFEEQWGAPSDPRIAEYLQSMEINLEEGQKAEVNLRALDWMEDVGGCLQKGFVLTIDYGYLARELYAPHRREGTLLCYYQHQTSQDPYERLGKQDITAHVDFSGLIRKGEEVGLKFTGLVPQYQFLIGLGLLQEMEERSEEMSEMDGLKLRLSLKHLIEPEIGMGEVFKVLIQHKGIERPQLNGLRDLHSISWGT